MQAGARKGAPRAGGAAAPAAGPAAAAGLAPGAIGIVLADHRELICEGIGYLARDQPGLAVTATVRSKRELFAALRDGAPRVVVLSPRFDPHGAAALLAELRRTAPRARVLMLASDADDDDPVALLRAGARGYLSRENDAADLFEAVRKVARGGLYVSKALGESIAVDLSTHAHNDSYEQLSPREAEVFGLLAQGQTVGQIAQALRLSAKTVSTHKSRLMGRLGLHTMSELIQYAMSYGVIEHPGAESGVADDPPPALCEQAAGFD